MYYLLFQQLPDKLMYGIVVIAILIVILILLTKSLMGKTIVETDLSDNAVKKASVYYYLPDSLLKIQATVKIAVTYFNHQIADEEDKPYLIEQKFSISSETIADTSELLALNYKTNNFFADEIKYTVNSKGLLATVDVTTEDKAAVILSKMAEITILEGGQVTDKEPVAPLKTVVIKEFTAEFIRKASDLYKGEKNFVWNCVIINENDNTQQPVIAPANFSIEIQGNHETANSAKHLINQRSSSSSKDCVEGILTRPFKNVMLKIGSDDLEYCDAVLNLPDLSKLLIIPINRKPFVKSVHKLSITDGIVLSNEINMPSSLEGFISIPVNLIKKIVSIPAQLIQLRINHQTNREKYEKAYIESMKSALERTKELEKIRLDIEKNNLEAEKKQLEGEKVIEDLRKELAKLKQQQA